jgi:DNA integrity scanning protein DisA with diadenylate cyclase activity
MVEYKWIERYFKIATIVSVISGVLSVGYLVWVAFGDKISDKLDEIKNNKKVKACVLKVESFKDFIK